MFTGIIESVGQLREIQPRDGDMRLVIDTGSMSLESSQLGDSLAVNGVCLTATELEAHAFAADVSTETLSCTTMGSLVAGSPVNLERALLPETRMGGHFVSGHVDGVAELLAFSEDARSARYRFRLPAGLARFVAAKGSICIDGTSLTVNDVTGSEFGVNIVPHTRRHTIFGTYGPGSRVNIEVDLLARYLDRLMTEREVQV